MGCYLGDSGQGSGELWDCGAVCVGSWEGGGGGCRGRGGAGPGRRGRGLGGGGRGRRARTRSRRAPSRPPCWLVSGCQTELDELAAPAAAPRAPVAPACTALLAVAAANRAGRRSGGEPGSGAGVGPRARTPPSPRTQGPRSQPPKRAAPLPPLGLPSGGTPFLAASPPHGLPAAGTPLPDPRAPFPIGLLVLRPRSPEPRSARLCLGLKPPAAPPSTFRSSRPARLFSGAGSVPAALRGAQAHPSGSGGSPGAGSRPDPVLLRAAARPTLPRDQVLPPHPPAPPTPAIHPTHLPAPPTPAAQRGRGRQTRLQLPFVPRGTVTGWGSGCGGRPPRRSVGEARPLPRWAAPRSQRGRSRSFLEQSWPKGVCLRPALAKWLCGRGSLLPQTPAFLRPGLRVGPFSFAACVGTEDGAQPSWGSDGEN